MMPILYLLGGVAQLVVAVVQVATALEDWRSDQTSCVVSLIIAALFLLCAFLMFIQVQP
jgi:hypothetical protein